MLKTTKTGLFYNFEYENQKFMIVKGLKGWNTYEIGDTSQLLIHSNQKTKKEAIKNLKMLY